MKTNICRLMILIVSLLVLSNASAAELILPACPPERDRQLWDIMNDMIMIEYDDDPMGVAPLLDDESRNDRLPDLSEVAVSRRLERVGEIRERIAELDRSGFSSEDRLAADLLAYWLDTELRAAKFKRWMMPVSSIGGPQVWLPQIGAHVPMQTAQHRKDYLTRLKRVPINVGDSIDNMRLGIDAGRVPARVVVEPTIAQAMAQASAEIREDPSASPFFAPFRSLDADDPIAIEAKQIILERIVPVYMELALFLQNEYLPACRETVGASAGIDGIAGYNAAIAGHTTLPNMSAEQIHEIGRNEVRRIRAEMMRVIRESEWYKGVIGFWDPTPEWANGDDDRLFEEFTKHLRTHPQFYYDKPEDLLDGYRAMSKLIDGYLPEMFKRLPSLPYGVRALPAFTAENAPTAYYYPGSFEAGRSGNFMANLSLLDQRPKYEMLALTLHEAVPGHHLQIALAQEIEGQHPIRKRMGFSAYVEGWGLYAERLGLEMGDDEHGVYSDPYDNFGRLNFEMWRAMRLVVDTGIHSKGWTRDQAIEFMRTNSALSEHNIAAEVDRYIGWPGQATAYKIGELKILELRAYAEKTLGDRFDLRAFHDVVLRDGAVPLPVLEGNVRRWVDSQGS